MDYKLIIICFCSYIIVTLLLFSGVRKFETSILRLYVVNTIQTNKVEKLTEFFEKMAPELQSHGEWREWFSMLSTLIYISIS